MHKDATFKLRLPQDELADWKLRAEWESLSLAAWIRERCNGSNQRTGKVPRESTRRAVRGRDTGAGDSSGVDASPVARHTAASNWRTCGCETCVQKRKAVA